MSTRTALLTLSMTVLLCGPAARLAAAQDMPPMPKPGPAHEVLKQDVGIWDAKVEMMSPNGTMSSSASETATLGCGGLCLISDFKGEMMPGMPFEGHGVMAYDSRKQKYVGSWTDSMSQGIMVSEGTYDPAAKSLTLMMEGPDMTGATVKMKAVTEYKDPNTKVFSMYNPDGTVGMKITYMRKK